MIQIIICTPKFTIVDIECKSVISKSKMNPHTAALRRWLKFSNFSCFIFRKFRTECSISNIKINSPGEQENKTNLYIHSLCSATCSDFIHRHNCKNSPTLSCFWKNNAWLVEKLITNRKCLESNGLACLTAHIPLPKYFTKPSCSPSHFWTAIFSVNLGNNLESKRLKLFFLWMWHGKNDTF